MRPRERVWNGEEWSLLEYFDKLLSFSPMPRATIMIFISFCKFFHSLWIMEVVGPFGPIDLFVGGTDPYSGST